MSRYIAYFTRHMPVALHERLRAVVASRNSNGNRPKVTLEDVVNEAIGCGLEAIEGKRRRVKWADVPDVEENDDAED